MSQLESIILPAKHITKFLPQKFSTPRISLPHVPEHFLDPHGFLSPLNRAFNSPRKPTQDCWYRFLRLHYFWQSTCHGALFISI